MEQLCFTILRITIYIEFYMAVNSEITIHGFFVLKQSRENITAFFLDKQTSGL